MFAKVGHLSGAGMRRAVFLDRDGTVCEEVGYLDQSSRLQVYPWAAQAISKLNGVGLCTVLVTNQSGVARGYFPEDRVLETHERLRSELARGGAYLNAIYYCPHHPDGTVPIYSRNCDCRKPGLGMIERAAAEYDLDLAASFVVGDKFVDLETAFRACARAVLVLSGLGRETYEGRANWSSQPDYIAIDLSEAVDWILTQI